MVRVVQNSLAFYNGGGLVTNDNEIESHAMNIYNNTFYGNDIYGIRIDNTSENDAKELLRVFKNNIAYNNTTTDWSVAGNASYTHEYNDFDLSLTIKDSDFISVDSTGVVGARQSDGSLPLLDFLVPKPDSQLVGAGTKSEKRSIISLSSRGTIRIILFGQTRSQRRQPVHLAISIPIKPLNLKLCSDKYSGASSPPFTVG